MSRDVANLSPTLCVDSAESVNGGSCGVVLSVCIRAHRDARIVPGDTRDDRHRHALFEEQAEGGTPGQELFRFSCTHYLAGVIPDYAALIASPMTARASATTPSVSYGSQRSN